MHIIPFEIALPKNEADFERMCAQVYGVVFDDRMPKMNGRRGQAQGGVDVFVKETGVGRVGIQCKKYTSKPVKWSDVEDEVLKADNFHTPIKKLILATTSPNDAALLKKVQELSDDREAKGLFTVEIEFWEDICNHVERFPVLQDSYAPHTPGAAYHRQEKSLNAIQDIILETQSAVRSMVGLPPARSDSVDRFISAQLDRTNELLKAGRYRDAMDHLAVVGKDLAPFDAHQKARWHLQKGLSTWFMRGDDQGSSELFLKAFELYPDDERMAAAQVRGLMLQGRLEEAAVAGKSASERFPESEHVWYAVANVFLMQGMPLKMKDVPEAFKQEPDTLQFIAHAELKAGNLGVAIELSQKAASNETAGFFSRITALRIAVECASRMPVSAMAGALPVRETEALEFAVSLFAPWHERLWSIQSDSVKEALGYLGYALLMLHRFSDAFTLAKEAEAHGYHTAEILRAQVTALYELGREDELLGLAAERLAEMNAPTLTIVGQVAAKEGNIALLKQAEDIARNAQPADDETIEVLAALRWEALMRSGQEQAAIVEVLAAKAEVTGGLISTCVAARVLQRAGRTLEADAVIRRAKTLVTLASDEAERAMLADMLYIVGHYADAGVLLERLITPGRLSWLHNRLLSCYVRTHNRRRARELIAGLPAAWNEDDETRKLAIELGQQVGDWAFLRPLVEAQLRRRPRSASSWLFKLSVGLSSSTPAEFQNDLRTVPEPLEGSIRSMTQLAGLELRYGEAERGMRRLYRMLRSSMDEPEAYSAYFIAIVGGPLDLPLMEDVLPTVATGTHVTLLDEFGHTTRLVIDPADIEELPKREGYSEGGSPQAAALIGAVVGQQVELPSLAFGGTQKYTVTGIQSAYRYMLQVVQERANALGGLPNLKMVPIGSSGNPEIDLTHMKAEVMRSSAVTQKLFQAYSTGAMTLSGFSARQGRSAVEVTLGWPSDGPSLFVSGGTEEERAAALERLARTDAIYVVDSLTLAELVHLGVQESLRWLPKVLISPVTKATLEQLLREAEDDRSVATGGAVNGQLSILEYGASHHAHRIELFKAILAAVDAYCEVQPAYGALGNEGEMLRLSEVLESEEMEVLLLAKATGATVLTLDGRFRFLLDLVAKVPGVWPQALLMHCLNQGQMDPMMVAPATVRQFLQNRSFVSLGRLDLIWMVLQGGMYLQQGLRRLKTYLSSADTEFSSAISVAFEFLGHLATLRIHLGAFGEIFEHLIEAAMRHKQCPSDFEEIVTEFVFGLTETLCGSAHTYPGVQSRQNQLMEFQRRHLAQRFFRARARLSTIVEDRPVAVRAIFCSKIPFLVEDKSSAAADPATKVELPSQRTESAEAVVVDQASATPPDQLGKAFLVAEPARRIDIG